MRTHVHTGFPCNISAKTYTHRVVYTVFMRPYAAYITHTIFNRY